MDIDSISVFVEATRAGSLAGAARELGLVPMAASRRLAALEAELGVRLVHRTTRALALTAEIYAQTNDTGNMETKERIYGSVFPRGEKLP